MISKAIEQKILTINMPLSLDLKEKEAKMIFACQLYEKGLISTGQAAVMVGVSRREFIETMGAYGASIFQQNVNDLESDIENA